MNGDTTEVLFALVVLTCALAVGALTGGRLANLAHLGLRRSVLVVVAVLAQLGGALLGGPAYTAGLASSAALIAGFLVLNRQVPGTVLVGLGLLSNAVVIGLNGAMPVSAWALGKAGLSTQDLLSGAAARHELADAETALRPLGDVIPVLLPIRAAVVSPGDVLVVAGLAQVLVVGMRRRVPPADG
jgi:hypothetical protein